MSEKARKEVESRFDINRIASDYLKVYEAVIKR